MKEQIKTFEEFYPFYLSQHKNKTCRLLHAIGTTIVLALALTSIIYLNPYWLVFIPFTGYGFAWVGHFLFEKNKPATFKYPLWSLKSDSKMYYEIISGKLSIYTAKDI